MTNFIDEDQGNMSSILSAERYYVCMNMQYSMSNKIYVGGLPRGTSAEELAQRFAPFALHGVRSISAEVVHPKSYGASLPCHEAMAFERNFGFVAILELKESTSIQRAVQVSCHRFVRLSPVYHCFSLLAKRHTSNNDANWDM